MAWWTQEKLDQLDAAFGSGASEVTYSDRTVRFHTVDGYLKLRALALSEISATGSAATEGRSTFAAPRRD